MNPHATPADARALGARLPPLLVAAERVAATVAQGVHGRRRVGQGDSFWQFRPAVAGDAASRIDWRQSARSDRSYIRETEWEAAQTVVLWRAGGEAMRWRSTGASVEKFDRAELLLLALAALLLRGGERVRLLVQTRSVAGRAGLERLAAQLAEPADAADLPSEAPLPRHGRIVLFGDFLSPLREISRMIAGLAAIPVRGELVQVLDPAEATLPYRGRVRFEGRELATTIPSVDGVRSAYVERLADHQAGIAALAAASGFGFLVHRTDQPPEAALLALHVALTQGRTAA